jgi:hypothetical protein
MDYAVALMIYLVSVFGVGYSIYCITRFKDDKMQVRFMSVMAFAFTVTTYIGGTMVQAVS